MNIPENEIHIYQFPLADERYQSQIDEFVIILSPDELAKANRFKFNKHRSNYITARYYLRILTGKYTEAKPEEIVFQYTDKDKPYLNIKTKNLKFNLAHSGNRCVYAFTNIHELGIDIERKREIPDAREICHRFFSTDEINDLNKVDEDQVSETFLLCWTRKEAFIKAVGEGLSYPLADFTVSLNKDKPVVRSILKDQNEVKFWKMFNVDAGKDYFSSLAVKVGMYDNFKLVYKDYKY
jgi:4'-phosphopantetheinyl transferase